MRRNLTLLNWTLLPATAVLLTLLSLTLLRLRHDHAADAGAPVPTPLPSSHPAAGQTRQFFGWASNLTWLPLTNAGNPFFTLAIRPAPPPQPPPPPPATKKVDVTYRGYFQTSAGLRRALVQVADKQVLAGLGEPVVADFTVLAIELRSLALTNKSGGSVSLVFRTNQSLEIPAK